MTEWPRQLIERVAGVFGAATEPAEPTVDVNALHAKIGQLTLANDFWRTHAAHLLEGGAELTTVRDNPRHASLATTSMYLHADDARRAKQVADRFAALWP